MTFAVGLRRLHVSKLAFTLSRVPNGWCTVGFALPASRSSVASTGGIEMDFPAVRLRVIVALLLAASAALAAGTNGGGPKYESLLLQVLEANRQGLCPADLMSEELKGSCESQLGDIKLKLKNLGAVTGVTYLGEKPVKDRSGEGYKVSFEHGDWIWTLSAENGRETMAFAPAPLWNVASYSSKAADWHAE